jgi:hypothetical protein
MAFLRNLLALIGLVAVGAVAYAWFTYGSQLREFDEESLATYRDMAAVLLETGNAAEATIWKVPVDEGGNEVCC